MPRYNVNHNCKWACFSSIVDAFITPFMEKSCYEQWRKCQYGAEYKPLEECNQMEFKRAISSLRIHHSHEETLEQLIECGIDDAEKLLYDVETEQYCPVEKEGKLFCPNCGKEVERGQVSCLEETCEIVFVWRDL